MIKKYIQSNSNIFADYNLLFSAFQNILTNAVKFTPVNGKIIINVEKNDNCTIIRIEDFGIGLSHSEIKSLLSAKNNNSRNGTNGETRRGLGFTIAKDFIELSDGILEFESEKEKGSLVIITFPKGK